jgi:DNA-binding GntR family transcriptional regulator
MSIFATDAHTLAERVYHELRQRILTGKLLPGQRLSMRPIARSLRVSVMPVAEAFRMLSRDGLIESEARFGSRVRILDREALRQQHVVRLAVECEAARQCAAIATDTQLRSLTARARTLDEATRAEKPYQEVAKLDSMFHLRIASYSRVPALTEILTSNQLLRNLTRKGGYLASLKHRHELSGHTTIAQAIASRDTERAESAMRRHCTLSMEFQLEVFDDEPDMID